MGGRRSSGRRAQAPRSPAADRQAQLSREARAYVLAFTTGSYKLEDVAMALRSLFPTGHPKPDPNYAPSIFGVEEEEPETPSVLIAESTSFHC